MIPDWDNIQQELSSARAPISEGAWSGMEALLDAQVKPRKKGWWLFALPLLIILSATSFLFYFKTSKALYHPLGELEYAALSAFETLHENDNTSLQVDEINHKNKEQNEEGSDKKVTGVSKKTKEKITELPSLKVNKTQTNSTYVSSRELKFKKVSPVYTLELKQLDVSSQDSTASKVREGLPSWKDHRFEIKAFVGPTYNFASYQYTANEGFTHKDLMNATDNSVKPGWGLDAGVELSYFVTRNFKISSGFGYRKIVTNNSIEFTNDQIPVIDSATRKILGYITLPSAQLVESEMQNQYTYFSIPLSLFQELKLNERWSVTGEFVNTASFLINQNSLLVNSQTLQLEETANDVFNPILWSYQIRLGLRYNIDEQWSLVFEPAYRGQYNNTFTTDAVIWKPRDISLNIGVIFKF